MQLSAKIRKSARRYEPIQTYGLTLWPVLVAEWDDFMIAREAIGIVQQAYPVVYAGMPLLSAYWDMHLKAVMEERQPDGLFVKALAALALTLRMGQGKSLPERVALFHIDADPETGALNALTFTDPDGGGEMKRITPPQFQKIRSIIAEQNGVELADETANPDLLNVEAEINGKTAPKLKADIEALLSSISALTGMDEAEFDDWPILKLLNRQAALQRAVDYIVCGIAEKSGTTWKNGNPVPSLFFERDMSDILPLKPVNMNLSSGSPEPQMSGMADAPPVSPPGT